MMNLLCLLSVATSRVLQNTVLKHYILYGLPITFVLYITNNFEVDF